MSGRDAVRMSDREVAGFLNDNLKVQVASIGRDGTPHLTTLFYVVLDGRIAFWTYARSQKIRNLERDPRISCLVEDGIDYFELRGVSMTGRAEIVRAKSLDELGDFGRATVEKQVTKRVAVVVHPDHVASWDHRKMV